MIFFTINKYKKQKIEIVNQSCLKINPRSIVALKASKMAIAK